MLVTIESNISVQKLTLFSTEEFFSVISTFVRTMLMETDALEITPDRGVNLLYNHPHPHGCTVTKIKPSPMLGNCF